MFQVKCLSSVIIVGGVIIIAPDDSTTTTTTTTEFPPPPGEDPDNSSSSTTSTTATTSPTTEEPLPTILDLFPIFILTPIAVFGFIFCYIRLRPGFFNRYAIIFLRNMARRCSSSGKISSVRILKLFDDVVLIRILRTTTPSLFRIAKYIFRLECFEVIRRRRLYSYITWYYVRR